jgi:hypothetical protein
LLFLGRGSVLDDQCEVLAADLCGVSRDSRDQVESILQFGAHGLGALEVSPECCEPLLRLPEFFGEAISLSECGTLEAP